MRQKWGGVRGIEGEMGERMRRLRSLGPDLSCPTPGGASQRVTSARSPIYIRPQRPLSLPALIQQISSADGGGRRRVRPTYPRSSSPPLRESSCDHHIYHRLSQQLPNHLSPVKRFGSFEI